MSYQSSNRPYKQGMQRKTAFRSAAKRAQTSIMRQAYISSRRARYTSAPSSRFLARIGAKETGFVDVAANNYALDTTGSITLLNTVAQGASVNQRIGKKWFMKHLQCRGQASANTTAIFNDCTTLIVYDKRPTGALPAITDVLNTANALSFNNDANAGRFKILKRWDTELIGNTTTPATGREAECADFFLPLNLPVVNKAAGTGAIADIEEGALYLVTVGANPAGNTAATLSVGFRLRFVDA